jgi:hypothetical protein
MLISRIATVLLLIRQTQSFHIFQRPPVRFASPLLLEATATREKRTVEKAQQDRKATLKFCSDFDFKSDPIPAHFKKDLVEYFCRHECRDLFVSSGGIKTVQKLPMSQDLVQLWEEACDKYYGPYALPNKEDDTIFTVTTQVPFPWLTVELTNCSGAKLIISEDGIPEYQFYYIGEKKSANGSAPMVWLYEKLTGSSSTPKNDVFLPPSGKANSRVYITESDGACYINFDVDFWVKATFSRLLLRILPTSKAKMEQQGSASISKLIAKEVPEAVCAVREMFLKSVS